MKLFQKIYWMVIFGMLLLAAGMLGYMLWEMQSQNLLDVCRYEKEQIGQSVENIKKKVQHDNIGMAKDTAKRAVIIQEFQNEFQARGALTESGRVVWNRTPYEFEQEKLNERKTVFGTAENEMYVSEPQNVGERKIVLFYQEKADMGIWAEDYGFIVYKDVTEIYTRIQALFLKGLVFTVVLLFVMGLALHRGIYRVIRPLVQLRQTAERIAGGDYESRAVAGGTDEIGEVTESFNRMAEKIEEQIETLQETNEKQKQLIGSMAHELKTPLTSIIGHSDLLLSMDLPPKKREEALGYILAEGKRLARLSEKMMELTGLYQSLEAELRMEDADVGELLERLKKITSFRLKEKGLCLEVRSVPSHFRKRMEADLMLSLLVNLVDNAYKASEAGSCIRVTADAAGITVEDAGRGIPAGEISRVTEAFYMVDKSRSKKAGGVGLGLALCEQIAAMHGGFLKIDSKEGEGTRVSILWQA